MPMPSRTQRWINSRALCMKDPYWLVHPVKSMNCVWVSLLQEKIIKLDANMISIIKSTKPVAISEQK
jgi:hypothetical protein